MVRPAGVAEDDPGWREQLEQVSDHLRDWTGNHAAISEVSAADARRASRGAEVTKRGGRTQPCDRTQARTRLENAQKSLEVAELAAGEEEIPASRSVAAALAVLSGIAAADAACCAALGRRSRGEDHREAAVLLRRIVPGGDRAAKALIELLNLKDTAQYGGLIPITRRELSTALRRAKRLLDFADEILRR